VYLTEAYPQLSAQANHSIARRLVDLGWEMVVLSSSINVADGTKMQASEEVLDGVRVRRIEASLIKTPVIPYVVYGPRAIARNASQIWWEIETASLVHSQTLHGLLNVLCCASLASKRSLSKLVVTAHGVPSYYSVPTWIGFSWWSFLMKQIGRRSRIVITVARSSIPTLLALGIPPQKMRYIPNGVDRARFHPSSSKRSFLRNNLGIDEQDVVVMSLGQLRAAKGVPVLLEAIPAILRKCERVTVLIAGSGPLSHVVSQWASKEKFGSRIKLVLRHISPDETAFFFNCCDLFVLPSYWEGLPLSLLEAMACGACPVASSVGDVPSVITDGVNGILVKPGNPRELGDKIVELVRDQELMKSIRQNSAKIVETHDWDRIAESYDRLYSELIN